MLERAPQSTACISPRARLGSQGHRAGKAWKMAPSEARVAGQSVEHYLQLMENPTTYATHTEIVAANKLIIVQHPKATGIGW